MLWYLERPSHRTTVTDGEIAVGNGVVVRTAFTALQYLRAIPLYVMM